MSQKFVAWRSGFVFAGLSAVLVAGCSAWIPSAGPTRSEMLGRVDEAPRIQVVTLDNQVVRRLRANSGAKPFSEVFPADGEPRYVVGYGDQIDISILEAPPASLFGNGTIDVRAGSSGARSQAFPEQMVDQAGTIGVPFVGRLMVAGKMPSEIEADIVARLQGRANQPQVVVRVVRNASSNVTVVGEVGASTRLPLTPSRERLLDAVAAAGGVRQPVNKITLQITRGGRVATAPLDAVIRDPSQNIFLRPGDVVTALHQPLSFTVLGATGRNEEVPFEAMGISLAQALARSGGLQDARADAQGVFVFRFEEPAALDWPSKPVTTTPENRVPVIYTVDMKNPASFFVAQGFSMRDRDLIFVSTAPAAELQKFLNLVMSIAYPVITVNSLVNN